MIELVIVIHSSDSYKTILIFTHFGCDTNWGCYSICNLYFINRTPLGPINLKSPYKLMFDEKSNIKHSRIFVSPSHTKLKEKQVWY